MKFRLLGKSGLRVSELCLGTMTFGEEWGWGASKDESKKVFDAYVEAGGNFIDTANRYTEGTSEKFVGQFVKTEREQFVLATKYTLFMRRDDPNASGNHRKNMVQALEASLERLGTDYIDLYWVHAWDYMTPPDEIMRALDDMVRAGKILYIGISDAPAWMVARSNTLAELRGWTEFVGLQVQYSLVERAVERELLPMARALDIGVTPWGVLGSGILTGKYSEKSKAERDGNRAEEFDMVTEKNLEVAAEVKKVADEIGTTPSRVAVSWVRQQPGQIIPIIGARTVKQLEDNLASLDVTLTGEQVKRLSEVSQPELGFPHDFLESDFVRDLVYGGTYERIEDHRRWY